MAASTVKIVASLEDIAPQAWDRIAGDSPFLQHAFLHGLHQTQCACPATGWSPQYVTLWESGELTGALPLYSKTHSWGEYVFDWGWAEAYEQHGARYYPKLLSAIPFTPASGPRLLAATGERRRRLLEAAFELAARKRVSSLHVLFPDAAQAAELEQRGMMLRSTVQFHWENPGLRDFGDFLAGMTHDKRKKIKQERRRVRDAGVEFRWQSGRDASEADWDFFTWCYQRTYRQHHSTPYLNRAFFRHLASQMPDNLLLVIGTRGGKPIACALNVHSASVLYGRYWGASEFHSGLHFETCYYQAIEFCIARGLRAFEGGAQGEHKLARGLLPQRALSAHWLADPRFSRAVEHFLARESRGVGAYLDELNEHSPFKSGSDAPSFEA